MIKDSSFVLLITLIAAAFFLFFDANLKQLYYQMTGQLTSGSGPLVYAIETEEAGSFESGSLEADLFEAGSFEAGSVESGSSVVGGPTALRNRKQQVTKIATTLIMLIAFTGLFLIVWVMIYGRYLKNRVKIRSCEIEPPEEFWYLKHKTPEQEPTEPESSQDDDQQKED